jgi:hypothetical protein
MIQLSEDPQPWEDGDLEGDFPLGDGVADTDARVVCPCCGEAVEIALDPGGGAHQEYVEDCPVCCNPWLVHLSYDDEGRAGVWLEPSDPD